MGVGAHLAGSGACMHGGSTAGEGLARPGLGWASGRGSGQLPWLVGSGGVGLPGEGRAREGGRAGRRPGGGEGVVCARFRAG